jgi:hypothetical protein
MAYRLTVLDQTGAHSVRDFDDYTTLMDFTTGPLRHTHNLRAVTMCQLAPFESTTWSQVAEGDEVLAPDGSVWTVDSATTVNGIWQYRITNVHDDRWTTTTPRPGTVIQRRPGVIAAVRQMLTDAGIATTFIR